MPVPLMAVPGTSLDRPPNKLWVGQPDKVPVLKKTRISTRTRTGSYDENSLTRTRTRTQEHHGGHHRMLGHHESKRVIDETDDDRFGIAAGVKQVVEARWALLSWATR